MLWLTRAAFRSRCRTSWTRWIRRCTKRRKDGQPCKANALSGLDACRRHCGMDPAEAKAKGAVVAEVRRWGLGDSTVEPGEVMLRLVSQSAARCEHYAQLLAEAYD